MAPIRGSHSISNGRRSSIQRDKQAQNMGTTEEGALVLGWPLAGYVNLGSLEHPWQWKWCWCPWVDIERNMCNHGFALRNLSHLPLVIKYSGPPDGLCGHGHTLCRILQSQSKSSIIYRSLWAVSPSPPQPGRVCASSSQTPSPQPRLQPGTELC